MMERLHLGSGARIIPGWRNLDLEPPPDLAPELRRYFTSCDLRRGLPLIGTGTVDRIYSEHFFEHLTRHEASRLMVECYRVLAPGGVIRVSVPNLRTLIEKYLDDEEGNGEALRFAERVGWLPATRCQLVNEGMRLWGHLFVYDFHELMLLFREVGFDRVEPRIHGMCSTHDMPIEGRPNLGDLVMEAQR